MPDSVCVFGGINIDVHLRSRSGAMIAGTSNPSDAFVVAGGVGRNIAENLARWGVEVTLLGAVGDDVFSASVLDETARAGVDVDLVRRDANRACGVYAALLDHDGNLAMGASAMDAVESIGTDYVDRCAALIRAATCLVVDANLATATIERAVGIANEAGVPVIAEPVSREKARRLAAVRGRVLAVTPNRHELPAFERPEAAGDTGRLLVAEWIVVTRGELGVALRRADGYRVEVAAIPVTVCDVSGAGDAFVAGLVYGMHVGLPFEDAAGVGVVVAGETVRHAASVARTLGPAELARITRERIWRKT